MRCGPNKQSREKMSQLSVTNQPHPNKRTHHKRLMWTCVWGSILGLKQISCFWLDVREAHIKLSRSSHLHTTSSIRGWQALKIKSLLVLPSSHSLDSSGGTREPFVLMMCVWLGATGRFFQAKRRRRCGDLSHKARKNTDAISLWLKNKSTRMNDESGKGSSPRAPWSLIRPHWYA